MTKVQMLAELKSVLRETQYDAAWGDELLLRYLAEGQDKFCEETGYFVDATNYTITTENGTASYALDERIISVVDVLYEGRALRHTNEEFVRPPVAGFSTGYTIDQTQRLPAVWQADYETGQLKLSPTPDAAYNLVLRVWRYSRAPLDDAGAEPELPRRFHRACVEWAAFHAMMSHDMEQQDKVKANDHLRVFEMYVRDGRKARRRVASQVTTVTSNAAYISRG